MARKTRTWEDARHLEHGDNTVHQRLPVSASKARARKNKVTGALGAARAAYAKRDRGEKLTWRESNLIRWASPQKSAEQRRKTGDDFIPYPEMVARTRIREKGTRTGYRAPRTNIKQAFTGRPVVERGNYREGLRAPDERGARQVFIHKRVERRQDWRTIGRKPKPAPAPAPRVGRHRSEAPPRVVPLTSTQRILATNGELREYAHAIGVQLPPRAGRNQILDAIDRHQATPGYAY